MILGAHLDSWDLATGGTDNGTGAIAVLEAARILKASGVKPKRTIRFVLFSGEEEGLLGSQAYVAAHKRELEKIQTVIVLDNGTGRITGMALQGREELRDMWKSMLQPLSGAFGPLFVKSGNKTGTDHLSFLPPACRRSTTISSRPDTTTRITHRSTTIDMTCPAMLPKQRRSWR